MKNIKNWLFGSFFRTIGKFIAIFLLTMLGISLFTKKEINILGIEKVSASTTITSYDNTYSTSNRYYYSTSNTIQNEVLGKIGTKYNGKAYMLNFYFKTNNLVPLKQYDITITTLTNDFTKNINGSSLNIRTSNNIDFMELTNAINVISIKNTATSSRNTNQIKIRIYVNAIATYTELYILNENLDNLTSVNNFGIKSITIDQVPDKNDSDKITENANNNANNIIDNANQNTNEIKDSIKDNLNNCRKSINIFNNIEYNNKVSKTINEKIKLDTGNYTFTAKSEDNNKIGYSIDFKDINGNKIKSLNGFYNPLVINFTITQEEADKITNISAYPYGQNNGRIIKDIMIIKGTYTTETLPKYEPFGEEICKSKIEEEGEKNRNFLEKLFGIDNLKYIIIPTEEQMQELLNEMQEKVNSKLGILGLPLTIYTRLMNLINTTTENKWCLKWDGVKVANFENLGDIIKPGEFCLSEILKNEKINTFRTICINIVGGLILLGFVQYLVNAKNRILDVNRYSDYEYISTSDIYDIDDTTGEATNHRYIQKTSRKEKR